MCYFVFSVHYGSYRVSTNFRYTTYFWVYFLIFCIAHTRPLMTSMRWNVGDEICRWQFKIWMTNSNKYRGRQYWCWRFYNSDRFEMLVTELFCWRLFVTSCFSMYWISKIFEMAPIFRFQHPSSWKNFTDRDAFAKYTNWKVYLKINALSEVSRIGKRDYLKISFFLISFWNSSTSKWSTLSIPNLFFWGELWRY